MPAAWAMRFAGVDDLRRRRDGFHAQAALGGVEGAGARGGAGEVRAVLGLAGVGGAEVERTGFRENVDRVEVFAAEGFDAGDVAVARGDEFLHERHVVQAEFDEDRRRRRLASLPGNRSA